MVYYGKNPVEVTLVKSVEDSSERRRPMTTTTRRASEATHYTVEAGAAVVCWL